MKSTPDKGSHLTVEEERLLGYNRRLIEQCRDVVRRVNEAAAREKLPVQAAKIQSAAPS
jgi:hypothetical protein